MSQEDVSANTGSVLTNNYKVSSKIEALYTGGKVQFSGNEEYLFCSCTDKVQVLHVDTGRTIHSLKEESDIISCFAASPNDQFLVTAGKNLLLRQWDWKEGLMTKTWKAVHVAPVASMTFDETSTLLATGSSDSTIKVWDIIKQYYTHSLKGSSGVVSLVCFHPDPKALQLFSASDDCKIRIWDLVKSRCLGVLESHFSVVTSLSFDESHSTMISSSRDNVLNVWDMKDVLTPNRKPPRTIPCFEGVESVIMLPKGTSFPGCVNMDELYFVTAGNKGKLRFWSLRDGKCVHKLTVVEASSQEDDAGLQQLITHASLCQSRGVISVVTFDHNIILYDLETTKKAKQFVGYNDEILDMSFAGTNNDHLAVVTNSNQMRLYRLDTMDCRVLDGHSKIILSLDVSNDGSRIVTGSKDHTVRIWSIDESDTRCLAVGKGHTHAVGSVTWARTSNCFVVSGSQDFTIKVWDVPKEDTGVTAMTVKLTEKVHDKDINSVALSPNDKLIATGSQDKTAKIWRVADGALMGVARGHKRGVWCVQFSPVDRCIATASGDSTVKIWSLSDFTCVKTLEGHSSSVLKVIFVSRGMQLISSGSDGLIKLWTIKSNECIQTFDEHQDKVWSIASNNSQNTLVSGGADSVIIIWKDVTQEEQLESQKQAEEVILKEQKLSNLLHEKRYCEAIGLAITLEQPFRVLKIIKDMLAIENGLEEVRTTVKNLRQDQIDMVLKFIVEWNTNAKNTFASQSVLSIILKNNSPYELIERPNMKETIEALLPYTERHIKRINRLLQQSEFIEYTWQRMKLTSPMEPVRTHGATSQVTEIENAELSTRLVTNGDEPLNTTTKKTLTESNDDTKLLSGTGNHPSVEELYGLGENDRDNDMEEGEEGEDGTNVMKDLDVIASEGEDDKFQMENVKKKSKGKKKRSQALQEVELSSKKKPKRAGSEDTPNDDRAPSKTPKPKRKTPKTKRDVIAH